MPHADLDSRQPRVHRSGERRKNPAVYRCFDKGKTLLVIAHRLSTIKNADQIIVLQNGQVENTGTHQQLLDGDSLYRDMWEAHIGAQNWSAGSGKGGN